MCPENPLVTHTDFSDLETMDLCEKDNVQSNQTFIFLLVFYAFHSEKSKGNSCAKTPPQWEYRDDGKEIYQALNSRVKYIKAIC